MIFLSTVLEKTISLAGGARESAKNAKVAKSLEEFSS